MSQTPTLSKVILDAIESRLTGLHTMLPGKVVALDIAKGKCDVQPLIQRINSDGQTVSLPIISNCPIAFYRAGSAAVYLPLAVGHNVEIRFCERSLEIWLSKGGTVDPADKRKHDLSDAVVYPGLYDFNQPPVGASATDIVIVNQSSKITLKPAGDMILTSGTGVITMTAAGKFKVQGAADELLTILSDLIQKLTLVKTPTMMGPETFLPSDISDLSAIKARLDGMKG